MNKNLTAYFYSHRVLGAIVIVAGLYLVVWGKSKDHKLEQIEPKKQIMGKEFEEKCCHKVITIKAPDGVCDKENKTTDVC